jgi:hypothetical protein
MLDYQRKGEQNRSWNSQMLPCRVFSVNGEGASCRTIAIQTEYRQPGVEWSEGLGGKTWQSREWREVRQPVGVDWQSYFWEGGNLFGRFQNVGAAWSHRAVNVSGAGWVHAAGKAGGGGGQWCVCPGRQSPREAKWRFAMKISVFRCQTDFELLSQIKGNSINKVIFKDTVLVRRGDCDYSPRVQKLAVPPVRHLFCQALNPMSKNLLHYITARRIT